MNGDGYNSYNNNYNNYNNNYNNPNNYVPYEAPGASGAENNTPTQGRGLSQRPVLMGVLFAIIGILIGGLGCFGIMQMVGSNKCEECNCPVAPTPLDTTALNTNFLKMELKNKNIIYSPLSIRYGLSLLDAGAAGETKKQIENVLGENELPLYENIQDVLSLANATFIRNTYQDNVLPSYIKRVTNDYNAEVFYDSFTSTEKMDTWIKQKTFNLIDNIGIQLTPNTEMVLANALAIQMDWVHEFNTDNTFGMTFYKEDESEMLATMMRMDTNSEDISYYMDNDVTMLKMPLMPTEESALEFVAVMPANGLTNYINNLDFKTIETALSKMTPANKNQDGLKIYIPKFKFDYSLDFKNDLENLGITDAFNENAANFSGMTSANNLFVSDAVHKANINFSEKGIKAAAITVFGMKDGAVPMTEPQPVVINIDKPFYFMIYDSKNNTVWFSGAVYEPNLWENDMATYQAG